MSNYTNEEIAEDLIVKMVGCYQLNPKSTDTFMLWTKYIMVALEQAREQGRQEQKEHQ